MARLAVVAVLLVTSLTFVAPKVNSTPRVVRHQVPSSAPSSESSGSSGSSGSMMAVVLGVIFGIALLPHSALAGTGSSRPEFQLVRPSYMQGIDAANAAVKPGEIDYITRSRIEAAQLPKAKEEMEMTRVKLQAAPSKEERVAASLKRLREYSGVEG